MDSTVDSTVDIVLMEGFITDLSFPVTCGSRNNKWEYATAPTTCMHIYNNKLPTGLHDLLRDANNTRIVGVTIDHLVEWSSLW